MQVTTLDREQQKKMISTERKVEINLEIFCGMVPIPHQSQAEYQEKVLYQRAVGMDTWAVGPKLLEFKHCLDTAFSPVV